MKRIEDHETLALAWMREAAEAGTEIILMPEITPDTLMPGWQAFVNWEEFDAGNSFIDEKPDTAVLNLLHSLAFNPEHSPERCEYDAKALSLLDEMHHSGGGAEEGWLLSLVFRDGKWQASNWDGQDRDVSHRANTPLEAIRGLGVVLDYDPDYDPDDDREDEDD